METFLKFLIWKEETENLWFLFLFHYVMRSSWHLMAQLTEEKSMDSHEFEWLFCDPLNLGQ